MFLAARDLLQEPGDITKKKEVFVIVSGIVNTLSLTGPRFTISPMIMLESRMPCLSYTSPVIDKLRDDLLSALYPDPDDPAAICVESLQSKVFQCLSQCTDPRPTRAEKEKYAVLKILSQILIWLENDKFAQPASEHVFVSVWSDVLNTLFCRSGLRSIPGELGSKASRESRTLTETVFGSRSASSASSRKVDMTIRVFVEKKWTEEICIFECKPVVTDAICVVQQRKSVRLNASILLVLENRGLDIAQWYPIIAETRGLAIDFYTLRRYNDVLGAGRATELRAWLPSDPSELRAFLQSKTLEVLLGFRVGAYGPVCEGSYHHSFVLPNLTFPLICDVGSDESVGVSRLIITRRIERTNTANSACNPINLSSSHDAKSPSSALGRDRPTISAVDHPATPQEGPCLRVVFSFKVAAA
ncbi:hypothetical protein BG000_008377 [Podila horticola]|nr:hypothetical protein BG000_008377 [Podila horticola]